ncbi:MAG TPA: hypothetical protein DGT23_33360 [Micromonosporaceae bacterium]|nr:hypothetical protein [Micromonosporaceae bacterium]
MSGKRAAAKKRIYTSFGAAVAALGAAILIGVIGGKVTALPERVPTAGDSFALTAAPSTWTGQEHYLAAGGYQGGAAITYLKFDVTLPDDRLPRRAWLWLGVDREPLPELVELTRVPDTSWQETTLTAATAPRLGDVVAAVFPQSDAQAIAFDVSKVIRASGVYAFAVTAPTSTEFARFVAREAIASLTGAPTITLEWSTSPLEDPTATVTPTAVLDAPTFTPSPRETVAPPVVSPWPSAPPSIIASASASASATTSAVPSTSDTPVPPTDSPSPTPPALPPPPPPPVLPPSPEPPSPTASPPAASPTAGPTGSPTASPTPTSAPQPPLDCVAGKLLVPSCGALWGVAPGAHTSQDRVEALADFEKLADKPQLIYHAYHRGAQLFPTKAQIELARDPANPRVLFLNWKPQGATWRAIANGHRETDAFLDRLSEHIKATFPEQFFFTVHHEPENDVDPKAASGMTAKDYAAAYRYVVKRLRANGVTNFVSTMCYMAYVPWNTSSWFDELYPGDDVVDWVAWDIYAHSEPGYGFGDFAEMMNRRSGNKPGWPGFYNWAARTFPDKPLMVAEWGVWYSDRNPAHQQAFFESARLQLELFPRVKAYVYFETPDAEGKDSRVHHTKTGLRSFQQFSGHPAFDVKLLSRRQGNGREESPWSTAPTPRPSRLS